MMGNNVDTWILVILCALSAWFVNQRKPQVLMVWVSKEHGLDSIEVMNQWVWKHEYYCPKSCKVQHAHLAHEIGMKCNPCNHWTFVKEDIIMELEK